MATKKMWTMREIKFIQDNYSAMTVQQVALELKRPQASVRHQAYRIGLKFKQEWEVHDYAFYNGDNLIGLSKVDEIAELANMTVKNLLKYRFKCYQKRSKKILVAI